MTERDYVMPDRRYMRLAAALALPRNASFAAALLNERPFSAHTIDVEVRYRDEECNQIGDCMGFELLTPVALAALEAEAQKP